MLDRRDLFTLFYSGTPQKHLRRATLLYDKHRAHLMADKGMQTGLEAMRQAARKLKAHMREMQLGEVCGACGMRSGGCCSLYMAGETDVLQLIMNMMAGVAVQEQSHGEDECGYLGAEGCIFIFKPMFCLNNNCYTIKDRGRAQVHELERLASRLLRRQAELEELLITFFRTRMRVEID